MSKKFGIRKSFDFVTVQILGIVTHWMHVEARGKISSGGLEQRREKHAKRVQVSWTQNRQICPSICQLQLPINAFLCNTTKQVMTGKIMIVENMCLLRTDNFS